MITQDELESAWQALSIKQREWLAKGPEILDLAPRTVGALARLERPVVEPVARRSLADDASAGRAHRRTPWGDRVAEYIRTRKPRPRGGKVGPVAPRARRTCQVCGRPDVAIVRGTGGMWSHLTPRGDARCRASSTGIVPGRIPGAIVNSSAKIPAPLHELVTATVMASPPHVECRDVAAEALARLMVDRGAMSEVEAREVWRVPEPLRVERVPASVIQGPVKSVCWSLPAAGCDALSAWDDSPPTKARAILVALVSLYWDRGDGEGSAWARGLLAEQPATPAVDPA